MNVQNTSNETNLLSKMVSDINPFWQQGKFDSFQGKGNIRINYCYFDNPSFEKAIVIAPGRCESYLKYKELTYQFYQLGYNVFIIDHRGQGLSQRLIKDRFKGHVDCFDDYIADLHQFIALSQTLNKANKTYLLAHSMGGAIALRYLQTHNSSITAAVLSSPMIGVSSGSLPYTFAMKAVAAWYSLNKMCSLTPWYFIGQSNNRNYDFNSNKLSQSTVRYQLFSQLYQTTPEIQLGGVSAKWLIEADKNKKYLLNNHKALTTPTLILQAGADKIVDNQAQHKFCQRHQLSHPKGINNQQPVIIEGAQHEIFFEQDQYREQALALTIDWFENHN